MAAAAAAQCDATLRLAWLTMLCLAGGAPQATASGQTALVAPRVMWAGWKQHAALSFRTAPGPTELQLVLRRGDSVEIAGDTVVLGAGVAEARLGEGGAVILDGHPYSCRDFPWLPHARAPK